MKRTITLTCLTVTGLLLPCMPGPALAQAPAQQQPAVVSPFDKDDPEIQQLRKLDWKKTDFDAESLETRTTALLAMQHVLSLAGSKASARLELLVDYFDQNKLGEAFVVEQQTITLPPLVSYEEAKKIACTFVKSDVGKDKFGAELAGSDEEILKAYMNMYRNSSKRVYEECIEARTQVRVMAMFLESEGKLEEFKKWAKDETKRKQTAREADAAKLRQVSIDQEKARQEQEKEKRRQAEAAASAKMEAYLQSQQQQAQTGQTVVINSDDDWDGATWWPGTGAYYATDAYRGYVRDKFQDRYQNWNDNRPQPKVRSGGRARGRR